MDNNQIHETAQIHPNVKIGAFNRIGKNVVIEILGNDPNAKITIGDNNIINDNTRIFVHSKLSIGDWNVFHNDMLMMAEKEMEIGHNCWFGQNTILDATGGLHIGNGVRVGMYSQIWTHVASGEQIEGCTLYAMRKTVIEDDVWLVGSCVVGSGITLGKKSTALINSVLTKDTEPGRAYAGSPAKLMEKANFYIEKTISEKFEMLNGWLEDFVKLNPAVSINKNTSETVLEEGNDRVIFTTNEKDNSDKGVFFLTNKTFNKSNSALERKVYKYLYNNKARFLPN
ncbi:acetyltransferase-like isoleucine patch superfamily enzyme [Chryseobacterium defluvii]|uniref:Acetyltransferase-like isoleucine patch superfamily enzyme n=1 Tax=Chryseobacterium defluvii TaxID=160396 RepID=A0A840K9S3_9FLAO|nr:hypothetical protein [Chryseobacterium defluvii]MBB4806191.1 acetyltransferase-like isoleucine patch superfamily enzyme [Chryseobacterium defluvii]